MEEATQELYESYFWAMMAAQALEAFLENTLQIEALDSKKTSTPAEAELLLKSISSTYPTLGNRVYALKTIDAAVSRLFPKLKPLIKSRNYLAHRFLFEAHLQIKAKPDSVRLLIEELDEARENFRVAGMQVQGANVDRLLTKMNLRPEQVADYE